MAGNVQVTSRVELNMSVLNMLDGAQFTALAETGDATLTELRDRGVMPFDNGNMQNDSTFVDDSQKTTVSIVTTAPQARRLYYISTQSTTSNVETTHEQAVNGSIASYTIIL